MEIGGANYLPKASQRHPDPKLGGLIYRTSLGEASNEVISYDQRPPSSTVYPHQKEPYQTKDGFGLCFPELALTPELKDALLVSMKPDVPPGTNITIEQRNVGGIEIRTRGDAATKWDLIPVGRRILGMLQTGLSAKEMADLLTVFDGQYEIINNNCNNSAPGKVFLAYYGNRADEKFPDQMHVAAFQIRCIQKLLNLGCRDLAEQALAELHKGFEFHGVLRGRDDGKALAWQQIKSQPWAHWGRTILDKVDRREI